MNYEIHFRWICYLTERNGDSQGSTMKKFAWHFSTKLNVKYQLYSATFGILKSKKTEIRNPWGRYSLLMPLLLSLCKFLLKCYKIVISWTMNKPVLIITKWVLLFEKYINEKVQQINKQTNCLYHNTSHILFSCLE